MFTGPTALAFLIGFVVPFSFGIYLSFTRVSTWVTNATWVGFSNYLKILDDDYFLHSLWYTTAFAVVTTVLINVVAFAIAYMLTKAIKGRDLFRSVFFMPNLIGGIVLGYVLVAPAQRPARGGGSGRSPTRRPTASGAWWRCCRGSRWAT